MNYHIFHSNNNQFDETEKQNRTYVGSVNAKSLEDAFIKTQNVHGPWNEENPCRSTSIGDVIQDYNGMHLVCARGFRLLTTLILSIFLLTSCSRYTGFSTRNGCGVWYPKKFERGVKMRTSSPSPRFGRY